MKTVFLLSIMALVAAVLVFFTTIPILTIYLAMLTTDVMNHIASIVLVTIFVLLSLHSHRGRQKATTGVRMFDKYTLKP